MGTAGGTGRRGAMSPQREFGFCYPLIAQIFTARPTAGTKKKTRNYGKHGIRGKRKK
jgi:hypothetical protein